ncbi:MAG: hypothetical protein ACKVQR_09870 [Aquabacterium sp.]
MRQENPAATRLATVRRLLAIFLLAILPFQFSWAAVASYCEHEIQGDGHFGHHDHDRDHAHHVGASSDAGPAADLSGDPSSTPDETGGATGDKTPDAIDLDCTHCHGSCSCGALVTCPLGLHGALSTAPPSATVDETGGAHAPTRPERPQWLLLA